MTFEGCPFPENSHLSRVWKINRIYAMDKELVQFVGDAFIRQIMQAVGKRFQQGLRYETIDVHHKEPRIFVQREWSYDVDH